jgi:hypothetical protein
MVRVETSPIRERLRSAFTFAALAGLAIVMMTNIDDFDVAHHHNGLC